MTRLTLLLDMPEPEVAPPPRQPDVEEEVRYALECIESGHNSDVEWLMISKLYKELMRLPRKSPRVMNILGMITPVLAKYGYHGISADAGENRK